MKTSRQQGFTLVEVMVALMIVALALTALMVNISSMIDTTAYLQQKTVANWVAQNQLEEERISNRFTNKVISEEKNGSSEMLGQTWYWRVTPVKTGDPGINQITVQVFADDDRDSSLVSITSMLDIYHKK